MSALALPDLAQAIDREHQAALGAARSLTEHAIRCGELLLQAKADVGHGGWLEWVETNCAFSQRTAQGYMRLARELPRLDGANAQRVADLSFRDALGALARQSSDIRRLPEGAAAKVIDAAEEGERLRDSLVRAVNEEKRLTQPRDDAPSDQSWTTVEVIPPGPPRQSMPPHDPELAAVLVAAIELFQATKVGVDASVIMETLNAIYCALQNGDDCAA